MAYHHVGIAVKNIARAHRFYTEAMGFELVKVVKRKSPVGGWTKHIFYDVGDGECFALWDLRGLEGEVLKPEDWRGGISTELACPILSITLPGNAMARKASKRPGTAGSRMDITSLTSSMSTSIRFTPAIPTGTWSSSPTILNR